jgi:hypothetical protein
MVWLGIVHWVQGMIYTEHRLEGSGDAGTATESSVKSDDRSRVLVVLVLLGVIVGASSNRPCRWWGGGVFRGRAFFPPAPRRPPPVLVGREGAEQSGSVLGVWVENCRLPNALPMARPWSTFFLRRVMQTILIPT